MNGRNISTLLKKAELLEKQEKEAHKARVDFERLLEAVRPLTFLPST